MKKFPVQHLFSDKNIQRLQFLCLYVACTMLFLLLAIGSGIHYLSIILRLGMLFSCILFFFFSLITVKRNHNKYPFKLSILIVAWFLLAQLIHFANGNISHHYTQFLPVYLLAFPFAAITCDRDRQTGLKALSMAYIAAALVWVIYTVLLYHNCVPQFLQSIVTWDGPRLTIHSHANICARGFMIGIAISLGFSYKISRTWAKFLLWIATALMFICLSLTNSRSTILTTSLLIGGILFFRVYKGGWVQLAVGIALVTTITISLFQTSQAVFQWNQQRLMNQEPAVQHTVLTEQPSVKVVTLSATSVSARAPAIGKNYSPGVRLAMVSENVSDAPLANPDAGSSPQNTLAQDLLTLNSRTRIWSSTVKHILENPSILIWGSHTTDLLLGETTVQHTHNAWLEILMRIGLPGLVISLIFTWRAVISSLVLLCSHQADLSKKALSLLMLCILFSSIFEPSLFFTSLHWNFVDFFFFLYLGYMLQWTKQLRTR